MLYAIMCLDAQDSEAKREAALAAHLRYLAGAGLPLRLSGPLVSDDGQTTIGSLFVVEAPNRSAAEAFNRADPFHSEGVWGWIEIHGFLDRTP